MDVQDEIKKARIGDNLTKIIFNPLPHDFECNYDIHGTGNPETFTIPSKENARFESHLSDHLGKHLLEAYVNMRGEKHRDTGRRLIFSDD